MLGPWRFMWAYRPNHACSSFGSPRHLGACPFLGELSVGRSVEGKRQLLRDYFPSEVCVGPTCCQDGHMHRSRVGFERGTSCCERRGSYCSACSRRLDRQLPRSHFARRCSRKFARQAGRSCHEAAAPCLLHARRGRWWPHARPIESSTRLEVAVVGQKAEDFNSMLLVLFFSLACPCCGGLTAFSLTAGLASQFAEAHFIASRLLACCTPAASSNAWLGLRCASFRTAYRVAMRPRSLIFRHFGHALSKDALCR